MPVIDGLDATRATLAVAPELPVVGQTAHAMEQHAQACRRTGIVATITKPIEQEALVLTILQHAKRLPKALEVAVTVIQEAKAVEPTDDLIDSAALTQRFAGREASQACLLQLVITEMGPVPGRICEAGCSGAGPAGALGQGWLRRAVCARSASLCLGDGTSCADSATQGMGAGRGVGRAG